MRRAAFLALLLAAGAPACARASSLSISSSSASVAVGSRVTVVVRVSSPDQAINAVSGTISYPKDKLDLVSLPKDGSIVDLWMRTPSVSAASGQVDFAGVVLNPGYVGTGGRVFAIVFRAKAAGDVAIRFVSGSILANDGIGTETLTGLGKASFSLVSAEIPDAVIATSTVPSPPAVDQGVPAGSTSTAAVDAVPMPDTTRSDSSVAPALFLLIPTRLFIFILAVLFLLAMFHRRP